VIPAVIINLPMAKLNILVTFLSTVSPDRLPLLHETPNSLLTVNHCQIFNHYLLPMPETKHFLK